MMFGYERQFTPTAWAGVFSSAASFGQDIEVTNLPALFDTVGCGGGFGAVPILDGDGGAVAGEADRSPTYYGNGRFSTAAGDIGWGGTISRWNFSAARRSVFKGGDFLTGAATCRVVLNRGSVGVSNIGFYSSRGGVFRAGSQNVALSAGYNVVDIPIDAGAGDTLCELYGSNAGNDESGQNLYFMGMRHKVDGAVGLTLGTFGIGGATVSDLAGTTIVTDASIADFVAVFEIDTLMINIGTNDGVWTATHYTNLLTLIDRYRTAVTNAGRVFKCLLISPYAQNLSDNRTIASYMLQAAQASSDVSFFDQGAVAGSYAYLIANGYLAADNVHPSVAGANYLARLINQAMLEPFGRIERAGVANTFDRFNRINRLAA